MRPRPRAKQPHGARDANRVHLQTVCDSNVSRTQWVKKSAPLPFHISTPRGKVNTVFSLSSGMKNSSDMFPTCALCGDIRRKNAEQAEEVHPSSTTAQHTLSNLTRYLATSHRSPDLCRKNDETKRLRRQATQDTARAVMFTKHLHSAHPLTPPFSVRDEVAPTKRPITSSSLPH